MLILLPPSETKRPGGRARALDLDQETFRAVLSLRGRRLYFAAKEWEKARRLYQSLVLQTLDADSGIAKADVY